MRRVLTALTLCFALATPAGAGEADDIRDVISDQIAAFARSDLEAAFEHASPGIQSMFGNPERFGKMVRTSYPMVWRPVRWEMMGPARKSAFGPVESLQPVLFVDRDGRLWEAEYQMQQVDGVWRINGVALMRLPGVAS